MSSDPNLVIRLLKELRHKVDELGAKQDDFSRQLAETNTRIGNIENTMGGMASHLFAITNAVKDHDRRLRKLETRPSK